MDHLQRTLWHLSGSVCTITMNNPEARNAFDRVMTSELTACFEQAGSDPAIRVVVLTGSGAAFCAGAHLSMINNDSSPASTKQNMQEGIHRVSLAIAGLAKPTIAMMNGSAYGAGLDLALACDLRVASVDAQLCESYINLGLIAGDGGTFLLPRLVGRSRALELLLSGAVVTGAEAARIGMVNRAVDASDLEAETYALAQTIAAKSPAAVRMMKQLVDQGHSTDFATALEVASAQLALIKAGDEHQRAIADFSERRRVRNES